MYRPHFITFNGTDSELDAVDADLGLSPGKTFTASMWLRHGGQSAVARVIHGGSARFYIAVNQSGQVQVSGSNSSSTQILFSLTSSENIIPEDWTWHHLLVATDLANGLTYTYIDDVDVTADTPTATDDNISWDLAWDIGHQAGSLNFAGDVADLWFDTTFLNPTTEANRRKFITSDFKPVPLGSDGSTPTSSQPVIYLLGVESATSVVPAAGNNTGSGGIFVENGEFPRPQGYGPAGRRRVEVPAWR